MIGIVVVMVKVQLDLAKSGAAESRQRFHMGRLIFLDRIKKGVPRWSAVAIVETTQLPRVLADPVVNPRQSALWRCPIALRLVVVRDADYQVYFSVAERWPSVGCLQKIGPYPAVQPATAQQLPKDCS